MRRMYPANAIFVRSNFVALYFVYTRRRTKLVDEADSLAL